MKKFIGIIVVFVVVLMILPNTTSELQTSDGVLYESVKQIQSVLFSLVRQFGALILRVGAQLIAG